MNTDKHRSENLTPRRQGAKGIFTYFPFCAFAPLREALFSYLCLSVFIGGFISQALAAEPVWEPRPGQTIVILGNTFAERMELFGHFEAFLHAKYPTHKLRVRNMGWSADTVDLQPRPFQFGPLNQKLGPPDPNFDPRKTWFNGLGADALIACFGMTESFGGQAGLNDFRQKLDAYLKHHLSQKYNGRTPPQIVLVSPIAHEDLGGHWPNPTQHNEDLAQYVAVMREVAAAHKIPFVDLFTPHTQWMRQHRDKKLTFNGIHVTEFGDRVVSQWMAQSLGWFDGQAPSGSSERAKALRALVNTKNDRFHRHFRTVNGEYIYGRRIPVYILTPGKAGPRADWPHLSDEEMRELHNVDELYDQKIYSADKPAPAQVWSSGP